MKLSIFGLGYVGVVSAACFADRGIAVTGVDPNTTKVQLLNQGLSPIVEPGISEILAARVKNGLINATTDADTAVEQSEVTFVCVGTPSLSNGNLDYSHVEKVCHDIGKALASKSGFHVVVIRSTILPGTMRKVVIPILEQESGKKAGVDFGVCNNPEFLREGSALYDFNNPPKTVIGETDKRSGDIVEKLYDGIAAPLIRCEIEVGEMVKYADNAWHATKVAFANEIGKFCKASGIDSHKVMDIFCQDTKLNLSPYYMRPGFAFGGSCLPKDVRALTYKAKELDVFLPLMKSLLPSNRDQLELGIKMIMEQPSKRVGILGFSFKAGTDDLRESPMVDVIERLIGKGYDLKLYDSNVNMARLMGANRDYILKVIPHIERLMTDKLDEVLHYADVIVIGNGAKEFSDIHNKLKSNQKIIDFIRIRSIEEHHAEYDGICW